MKTRVVNRNIELYDVYIGRPSKWGNPFKPKNGSLEARRECIREYSEWLTQQEELMASLHELKGKSLGCWCKPSPCHGDILVQLTELYAGTNKTCST